MLEKIFIVKIYENNNDFKLTKILRLKLNSQHSFKQIITDILRYADLNINYYKETAKLFFSPPEKNQQHQIIDQNIPLKVGCLKRNVIYLVVNEKKTENKTILKESIKNYYFYESDNDFVSIVLKLDNVGKLEKHNIESSFRRKSLKIIINNLGGKNYIFAVPKLHHKIISEQSKYILKKDKIILKIKKAKKEPFVYLHAQKMIGNDISSEEDN